MPEHGHPGGGLLLADPDHRVRLALQRLVTTLGGTVLGDASTVDEALTLVRRSRPQAAIVEPLLPTLSAGCQLMTELRRLQIPVLALANQIGLRRAALDAGARSFLSKDSPPDLLLATLVRVCAAASSSSDRIGATP